MWTSRRFVVRALSGAGALVALAALRPATAGGDDVLVDRGTFAQTVSATRARWLASAAGQAQPALDGVFQPFDSGSLKGDGPGVKVSLDVSGVKVLRLCGNTEAGTANCQIWGEPQLVAKDGTVTRLTTLKPLSVSVGWGELLTDKNWQGHPLCVGEKQFGWGLWVHTPSEVSYRLDGHYARFEAWFGEDRDRANGKLNCKVVSGEPTPLPACWDAVAAAYPTAAAALRAEAGGEALACYFAPRADARLERGLVDRAVARAGSAELQAEAATLTGAPAGDARWLELLGRADAVRQTAGTLRALVDGPTKAGLLAELDGLARERVAGEDPRWAQLRHRAVLADEVDAQYESLTFDLANRQGQEKYADQVYRAEALIQRADRDPLDVVVRRTGALLADLRRTAAATRLSVASARYELLRKAAADTPVADTKARRTLFADACAVRRTIALANPLLNFDSLVFAKRHRANYNHMCDQFYGVTAVPGGGLYRLEHAFGPAPTVVDVLARATVANGRLAGQRLLAPARPPRTQWDGYGNLNVSEDNVGGAFLSPSLSFDAKQLLFAYVECRGDRKQHFHTDATKGHWDEGRAWHIFRVNVDGTGLTQLTDGTWNEFDPTWLPNGRIAFISERRGGYLRCGRACPNYNLYDMAADGSEINCLSFHETNEWNPSVTHDGRLIYTRWDYVDRYGCTAHHPWITTLDGTDSRAVHGNFAPRNQRPDMELAVQAIPGSQKYVAVAAPHHGQHWGSLVVIDPRVKEDDPMAPVKRVTPEVGFPESQGGREVYGQPWPLSEDYFLCTYDDAMNRGGRRQPGNYGIYLVDSWGNRELLYRDPDISCSKPIPLRATPRPPVTPAPSLPQAAPTPGLRFAAATHKTPVTPGDVGEGTMAVVNVYDTLRPWGPDVRIKSLRVVQVLPMSVPSGGPPHETGLRIATAGDSVNCARWVLGEVPVEADGSAYFKVPANRELYFQALDEKGLAVQSMRSATYVRNGEHLVCAGCHEPKFNAPKPTRALAAALRRAPSTLVEDVDGSKPFSYPRLVQPVLDKYCVGCHAKSAKAPNLGKEPLARKWYASYNSLLPYAFTDYKSPLITHPGGFGARASRLFTLLEKGHHDVKLPPEDLHRLTLWLDCASMFYGVYEKEGGEAQLRGELAQPTLW